VTRLPIAALDGSAIPEYERTVALDRNWVNAIAALGLRKFHAGAIEQAIPAQEQAIRLSPGDPGIGFWYFRIGEAHLLQSHIDDAILWFEKAGRALPEQSFFRGYLTSAYALKGDSEHAAAELAEARKLGGEGSWQSIARLRANTRYEAPTIRALAEATFYAGLRTAGVPEQ